MFFYHSWARAFLGFALTVKVSLYKARMDIKVDTRMNMRTDTKMDTRMNTNTDDGRVH